MNPDDLRHCVAEELAEIAATRMPFGRCAGRPIYDIPAEYLAHFDVKGWPSGRLGDLLRIVYHTKVDGADCIFDAFRR